MMVEMFHSGEISFLHIRITLGSPTPLDNLVMLLSISVQHQRQLCGRQDYLSGYSFPSSPQIGCESLCCWSKAGGGEVQALQPEGLGQVLARGLTQHEPHPAHRPAALAEVEMFSLLLLLLNKRKTPFLLCLCLWSVWQLLLYWLPFPHLCFLGRMCLEKEQLPWPMG